MANPEAFAYVYRDRRRVLLRRFPYSMVYRNIEDQIVVLAFIHSKRNARAWKKRE